MAFLTQESLGLGQVYVPPQLPGETFEEYLERTAYTIKAAPEYEPVGPTVQPVFAPPPTPQPTSAPPTIQLPTVTVSGKPLPKWVLPVAIVGLILLLRK